MKSLFLITGIILLSLTAWAETPCGEESHYPLISKKELQDVVAKKAATIFDVNSQESYQTGHVPGAIHYGTHEKDFATFLPKDKKAMIVAYCGGPMCGSWKNAAQAACKLGYTNIRHFKEGIKGWKN